MLYKMVENPGSYFVYKFDAKYICVYYAYFEKSRECNNQVSKW